MGGDISPPNFELNSSFILDIETNYSISLLLGGDRLENLLLLEIYEE